MTSYEQAFNLLASNHQSAIKNAFAGWSSTETLKQVSTNISTETALSKMDFVALLKSFATDFLNGISAEEAWIAACRKFKLKGCQIPTDKCPEVLGRARSLDDHAKSISKASNGCLTPTEAKKSLLKYSGLTALDYFEFFLRAAALGNFLVWATFHSDDSRLDPFTKLPGSQRPPAKPEA